MGPEIGSVISGG